jgi:hypothetical protein
VTAAVVAVVAGSVVWAVLAGALAAWIVVTEVVSDPRLPDITAVLSWWLRCWLGRLLLLATWAGAGWHLFCQRP